MSNQDNSKSKPKQPLWGILGGMGPLASAEFLNTIYRLSLEYRLSLGPKEMDQEQGTPRIVLVSDPTIPDRTQAIKERDKNPEQYQKVKDELERRLKKLLNFGVDYLAIACVTAHHFINDLPQALQSRLTSLRDIVCEKLDSDSSKYLLLRTIGTEEIGIFESHPLWPAIVENKRVEFLNDDDQKALHWGYLYQIKKRGAKACDLEFLQHLKQRYQVDGFIAGCTEVHLLTKGLIDRGIQMIDPLYILAQRIAEPVLPLISQIDAR
jgi:aspartate racemase